MAKIRKKKSTHEKQLTFQYLLAISIVFLLSLSTLITLQYVIDKQDSYATIINISGRQRMLSQRTTLLLFHLYDIPDSEQEYQKVTKEKLLHSVNLMERSHEILTTGKLPDGSDFTLSPIISKMYFNEPVHVDTLVSNHINTIKKLLANPNKEDADKLFHNHVSTLLSSLNDVVQQYENESNRYTIILKRIELTVFIVTLLVLLCIIFFIFRPMIRSVVENENALNTMLDHLPVYMDIVSKDGIILYQSKYLSDAIGAMTIGKKCFEVYKDDCKQCSHCPLSDEIITNGNIITVDDCLAGRTLQIAHVEIPFRGQPAILETFTDITEQQRTEQYLVQAKDAAEKANKMKSEFLASMSHEIKTPINAIIGLIYLTLETEITAKQRDYLNKISSSADRLVILINDLLDFSKIETKNINLKSSPFNLSDTMDTLASLTTCDALEKGLEVNFNIEPDVPFFLIGDQQRLEQILKHLIDNALKFTDRGYIDINTEHIKTIDNSVSLRFTVNDSGTGVQENLVEHIFQPFSQGENSNIRKHGGTGMGLAMCRELVDLMGGHIHLETKTEPGSLFSFTLDFPVARKQKYPSYFELSDSKMLIVDDHPMARKSIEYMLSGLDLNIKAVSSAEEALDELEDAQRKNKPYDFITLDWQMPGMSGVEAGKKIKENRDLYGAPSIILITAFSKSEAVQQAEKDFDGLLLKPINRAVLMGTLLAFKRDTSVRYPLAPNGQDLILPTFLPGIDTKKGLAHAGGNKRIYTSVLKKFSLNQSFQINTINQAHDTDDQETVHRLIHTLKGVAGNIGAITLQNAAQELEKEFIKDKAIDQGTFEDKLNSLNTALQEVLNSIASLHSVAGQEKSAFPDAGEITGLDTSVAVPLVDKLIRLLEESDTEAEQYLEQLIVHLKQTPLHEKIQQLQEKIGQYEFEEALEIGKFIRSKLNG